MTGVITVTNLRTRFAVGGVLAGAYLLFAQIGFHFASIHGNVSPVWPASAVALTGIIRLGVSYWPAIYLAAFVASLSTGTPLWVALVAAAGVVLEVVIGARLLQRSRFLPSIESPRDLAVLWLLAAIAAVASPTLGVPALRLSGMIPAGEEFSAWATWYLGDLAGLCLLTPFLLSTLSRPRPDVSTARLVEFLALLTATATALLVALDPHEGYPYLPFIPLLWAAFRFDLRVTSLVCAFVALLSVWEASQGRTQFVADTVPGSLVQTYRFVLVFGGVGLLIAASAEKQRSALAALRSSDDRFRTAFRKSPLPKTIIELATGRIVDLNDAFLTAFGLQYTDVVGRAGENLHLWVREDERDRFFELARSGPLDNFAADLRTSAGTVRHGLLSAQPVEIDGQPHLLTVLQDLTEYRNLQEQFVQAQKMESVGRLAGGVAHDFNNLITVIIGTADLLLAGMRDDDPLRDDLVEIHRAGHRAADLTRQLLAFSRRQVFEPRSLNLNATLASMGKMLPRLIGEDIDLVIVPTEGLGNVRADPAQLEQVIINLVINSRDAMPEGGRLTIETANVQLDDTYVRHHFGAAPGSYVMLAVSDTGMGMDEATRERVFEPFFTTKAQDRGTGLGLSTVYGIVKQHGGNVWVYSEPGAGTTFKIYLPLVSEPVSDVRTVQSKVSRRGTETILLVEDESAIRQLAERILTLGGYTVMAAATPGEALSLAEQHAGTIHLLLTDVVMPEMRGPELAARLLEKRPETKVLYMSGYTENAIVHGGVLDEGTHLLSKPFEATELLRKVRDALEPQGLES